MKWLVKLKSLAENEPWILLLYVVTIAGGLWLLTRDLSFMLAL